MLENANNGRCVLRRIIFNDISVGVLNDLFLIY
jgi:hypothetical protein